MMIPVVCAAMGQSVELIRDGKPCAEIVVAENADEPIRLAAQDLQYYLAKMSGAELPIVTADQSKGERRICVGESACTRLDWYRPATFKTSGFEIRVQNNVVILAGLERRAVTPSTPCAGELHPQSQRRTAASAPGQDEGDCGASHAVTALLELLGVRFYAPCEDGAIIPRQTTVTVPWMSHFQEAAFARRQFQVDASSESNPEVRRWLRRLQGGSSVEPTAVLPLSAVFRQLDNVPDDWQAKDRQGRPLMTSDGHPFPRFAQPGFQQACVKLIRQTLEASPGLKRLELALPMLRGDCDSSDYDAWLTKRVYPQPVASDIMVSFFAAVAREVGKTHPDCLLVCQGAPDNVLPSPDICENLPANLLLQPVGCGAVLYGNPDVRKKYQKKLAGLAELKEGKEMQQVEWWDEPALPGVPRQGFWFMHGLQKIRQEQMNLLNGFRMVLGNGLSEISLTHLMYYVNGKLLWNPELDLNALLEEYCLLWFGSAAIQMKSFFQFAESIAERTAKRSISPFTGQLLEEDLPIVFELLAKAKEQTQADTVYRRRVEELERSLAPMKRVFDRFTPGNVEIPGTVLPNQTVCDGNLDKYQHWFRLPGENEQERTEFALAVPDSRNRLFVAFRCFEPNVGAVPQTTPDAPALFQAPHVSLSFANPYRNTYTVSVNPGGSFCDSSTDPEELAANGDCLGWNPQTVTWAKRMPDHWEAEVEFTLSGCGKLPDWSDAWRIGVTRTRLINGKPQSNAWTDGKFMLPRCNSRGAFVYENYAVPSKIPGTPDECAYMVRRATTPVELSADWDSPCWRDVPVMQMGWEMVNSRSETKFLPAPQAKIQYDDQFLYVLYQVRDNFIRGTFKNDQDMVCLDSCMEFFVQPTRPGPYYNFECNCIGTLLLYEVTPQDGRNVFSPLPLEELKAVQRFATLPRNLSGELQEPVTWRLGLKIPLEMFCRRTGVELPLSGQVWRANVYKCADWTSNPRWLMWKKNRTFHAPDGFGTLIFE
ncbi:MAG: hypothetical protein IJJ33_09725 [Victivallales bacterium]|nr:hypothetical protein [Victivallales bacterium]